MAAATKKKGLSKRRGKLIEGDINQSKRGLVTTEAAAKEFLKIYPPLEKVGTKPAEHANVRKIFIENNMDHSHIVLPFPVENCRSGNSLSFFHVLYHHYTISPFTIAQFHSFFILSYS